MHPKKHIRNRCEVPLLAVWQLLIRGLLDGKSSSDELRRLEQMIASAKFSPWWRALNQSYKDGRHCDPEIQELLAAQEWPTNLEHEIELKGFIGFVESAPPSHRQAAMRTLAALLHEPDRLSSFLRHLYQNGLADWCRAAPINSTVDAKRLAADETDGESDADLQPTSLL
jgi:hypothetical protein